MRTGGSYRLEAPLSVAKRHQLEDWLAEQSQHAQIRITPDAPCLNARFRDDPSAVVHGFVNIRVQRWEASHRVQRHSVPKLTPDTSRCVTL